MSLDYTVNYLTMFLDEEDIIHRHSSPTLCLDSILPEYVFNDDTEFVRFSKDDKNLTGNIFFQRAHEENLPIYNSDTIQDVSQNGQDIWMKEHNIDLVYKTIFDTVIVFKPEKDVIIKRTADNTTWIQVYPSPGQPIPTFDL